ncbi:MAG: 6-phosphogluconolactonase [Candidatus Taylorbacteria bacterium]|nr:6-phosphogluconolactonase [Candidatus Taylorbacteria bacterium]
MIDFVKCKDPLKGQAELAGALVANLKSGKRTVWTLPGGSNVPISVAVLRQIREIVDGEALKNLVVLQCDERYGMPGHPDSNWQQLKDINFPIEGVENYPLLMGRSLEGTAADYALVVEREFRKADAVIGQFGIGEDGHIAGLMPNSAGFKTEQAVVGYVHSTFTRLSITPIWLARTTEAFLFAFGPAKREAILKVKDGNYSIEEVPAAILWKIPTVYFYTDQV